MSVRKCRFQQLEGHTADNGCLKDGLAKPWVTSLVMSSSRHVVLAYYYELPFGRAAAS
jgi:hypothetical protein